MIRQTALMAAIMLSSSLCAGTAMQPTPSMLHGMHWTLRYMGDGKGTTEGTYSGPGYTGTFTGTYNGGKSTGTYNGTCNGGTSTDSGSWEGTYAGDRYTETYKGTCGDDKYAGSYPSLDGDSESSHGLFTPTGHNDYVQNLRGGVGASDRRLSAIGDPLLQRNFRGGVGSLTAADTTPGLAIAATRTGSTSSMLATTSSPPAQINSILASLRDRRLAPCIVCRKPEGYTCISDGDCESSLACKDYRCVPADWSTEQICKRYGGLECITYDG